jgi:aspartate/methionine/tyrosine aminotransferase
VNLSRRAHWSAPLNRLTLARQSRGELLDLTLSNPTRAGIDYPLDALSAIMARAARAPYDPEPLGLPAAREALARELGCEADDVILTASTSEAYGYLFKLLCDPGDAVLTATPSYPLLEQLAALELIELRTFALDFHQRWELDPGRVREALTPTTRAFVVVSPNNPTGSYVTESEQASLAACGLPIISDEVFRDYAVDALPPAPIAGNSEVLTFTLGGLSKGAGLPHYKLGWIRIGGPRRARDEARRALELIADNFLSVATPVQTALPELLPLAPRLRAAITYRLTSNLLTLRTSLPASATVLPVEGGWSAVIRIPQIGTDEAFALELIESEGVVVQPGYFFDFDREGYIVISLLTPRDTFDEGVARIARHLSRLT